MSRLGWICLVVAAVGCGRRDFNEDIVDAEIPIDGAPCTEPPLGCMNPAVYVCGGVCYAACAQNVSRPAASAACADWGGCLAIANNQNTNDCAASRLQGAYAWIGLLQKPTATVVDADWQWCDGTARAFEPWRLTEPNDLNAPENGEQNCTLLYNDGTWTDEGCGLSAPFVCSRPL